MRWSGLVVGYAQQQQHASTPHALTSRRRRRNDEEEKNKSAHAGVSSDANRTHTHTRIPQATATTHNQQPAAIMGIEVGSKLPLDSISFKVRGDDRV